MSDLDKLIAAVDAGTLCAGEYSISAEDVALIEAVFPMDADDEVPEFIGLAMDGSLDAAKRLHDALLPGWEFWLKQSHAEFSCAVAWDGIWHAMIRAEADTPARAWLLAILRAYRATQAKETE